MTFHLFMIQKVVAFETVLVDLSVQHPKASCWKFYGSVMNRVSKI